MKNFIKGFVLMVAAIISFFLLIYFFSNRLLALLICAPIFFIGVWYQIKMFIMAKKDIDKMRRNFIV